MAALTAWTKPLSWPTFLVFVGTCVLRSSLCERRGMCTVHKKASAFPSDQYLAFRSAHFSVLCCFKMFYYRHSLNATSSRQMRLLFDISMSVNEWQRRREVQRECFCWLIWPQCAHVNTDRCNRITAINWQCWHWTHSHDNRWAVEIMDTKDCNVSDKRSGSSYMIYLTLTHFLSFSALRLIDFSLDTPLLWWLVSFRRLGWASRSWTGTQRKEHYTTCCVDVAEDSWRGFGRGPSLLLVPPWTPSSPQHIPHPCLIVHIVMKPSPAADESEWIRLPRAVTHVLAEDFEQLM